MDCPYLSPQNSKPSEDAVIVSLQPEVEILKKTMQYYVGTTHDIGRNKRYCENKEKTKRQEYNRI